MYRFKTGKLEGMTMEHALLRSPHRLYKIAKWAEQEAKAKPALRPLVREFHRLKTELSRAPIYAECHEEKCKKKARFMSFERTMQNAYDPDPFWWCSKHGPGDQDEESPKMPIAFNFELFRTKEQKRIFSRRIREALGIKDGTRITESFAHRFIAKLGKASSD